jgi:trimethylamine:corrinoid methyltransferase-like protein
MDHTAGKDMRERAKDAARQILAKYHPKYVTDDQAKEIDRIARDAQEYFLKTSFAGEVM